METLRQLLTGILKNGERKEEDYQGGKLVTITTATGKYTFAQYPGETDSDIISWLIKRGRKQERLMNTRFDTRPNPKPEPQPKHQAGQWLFFFTENETTQPQNAA